MVLMYVHHIKWPNFFCKLKQKAIYWIVANLIYNMNNENNGLRQ